MLRESLRIRRFLGPAFRFGLHLRAKGAGKGCPHLRFGFEWTHRFLPLPFGTRLVSSGKVALVCVIVHSFCA